MKRRETLKAAVVFTIVGSITILVPPKILFRFDRRTGYQIYKQTLESTGREKQALKEADIFYNNFGCLFVVLGVVGGLVSCSSKDKDEDTKQNKEN